MLTNAIFIPLAGAALVAIIGERRRNLRETVNVLTAVSLLAFVVSMATDVERWRPVPLIEVLPGLALVFEPEPLGVVFGLVASGLWILTALYSIGYMRAHHEAHQTRFYACFALTIAAAMGIAFAGNLFTLFVFYEMMTLVTYPLVTHHGGEKEMRAGRVYLGYLFGTSVGLFLLAIIWTWHLTGTLDFRAGGILAGKASSGVTAVLLALYAFGIGKAALMPFHRWLPTAMVAPAPVSALLHAVAVVKAGVFTVVKVVVYIFGLDFLRDTGASVWLGYAAAFTTLAASLIALKKDDLKARLAYSTVGQLSYIVLGAALANSWGVRGAAMHIVMHAFGKITLFFCAGAIAVAAHKTKISEMDGIGWRMPWTMGAFFAASLSVIGLPPSGGLWSKWNLLVGTAHADQIVLLFVLLASSLLSLGYLLPIPLRAFFAGGEKRSALHEAPLFCVLPLCLTAAGSVALFFLADKLAVFLMTVGQW
jgi:multicomponent Na+:H+ antiporter subunit D